MSNIEMKTVWLVITTHLQWEYYVSRVFTWGHPLKEAVLALASRSHSFLLNFFTETSAVTGFI